jgi:hypothetical protein
VTAPAPVAVTQQTRATETLRDDLRANGHR